MSEAGLGEYLRLARERNGVTIEQLASATKINLKILQSLEADQYADLPAKPFLRGFVLSYCRFINLNPKETFARFEGYLDQRLGDKSDGGQGLSGYAFEKKDTERSRLILGSVLGFLIVAGLVSLFILKPALRPKRSSNLEKLKAAEVQLDSKASEPKMVAEGNTTKSVVGPIKPKAPVAPAVVAQSKPEGKKPEVAEKPKVEESAQKSLEPNRVPAESDPLNKGDMLAANEIQYKTVLKAEDDVWIRYQVDARPIMRITLKKGKLLVLRAKDRISLQSAQLDRLKLSVQNQGYKSPTAYPSYADADSDSQTFMFPGLKIKPSVMPFQGLMALPTL